MGLQLDFVPIGIMTGLDRSFILLGKMNPIETPTPAAFGAAIRARRLEKGLTQTQLAELCGVSLRFVSELERGRTSVSLGRALLLAQRLALDPVLLPRERP
jgi:HTH-type transcriptional regulator/antitoxin HipB